MQKGFAPILVLIGILVITVIAGAFYFGKISTKLAKTPIVTSQTPQTTPSISTDTSNWKTYTTNNQLDIEDAIVKQLPNFKKIVLTFKYPPSWGIVRNTNTAKAFATNSGHTFLSFYLFKKSNQPCPTGGGEAGPKCPFAEIDMQFGVVQPGLSDFDSIYWGGGQVHKKEEKILINNVKTTQGYSSDNYVYPSETLFHISPIMELYTRNSGLYENFNNPTLWDKDTNKEVPLILSTFKFTTN